MKVFTLIFLTVFAQVSLADNELIFSEYQSDIRIKSINNTHHIVNFSGELEATGTIVFRLDMLSETEFGEPLFVDFIPDPDQKALFPEVVSGFYAEKLERISLLKTESLYQQLFGATGKSKTRELRKSGRVKLKAFATSVECDSRQYYAEFVSFTASESVALINNQPINGC